MNQLNVNDEVTFEKGVMVEVVVHDVEVSYHLYLEGNVS